MFKKLNQTQKSKSKSILSGLYFQGYTFRVILSRSVQKTQQASDSLGMKIIVTIYNV